LLLSVEAQANSESLQRTQIQRDFNILPADLLKG
jgi:hypothetical protein